MKPCDFCKKPTTNPRFCSRSCSAKATNKEKPRRKLQQRLCKCCEQPIKRKNGKDRRKLCKKCFDAKQLVDWSKVTYGEVKEKRKYQKNSRIRNLARNKYLKSDKPKQCVNCGYEKHIEVCHIKSISSFSDSSLVTEINDLSNLIALCPNCHWEFDNGHLQLVFPEFKELHS